MDDDYYIVIPKTALDGKYTKAGAEGEASKLTQTSGEEYVSLRVVRSLDTGLEIGLDEDCDLNGEYNDSLLYEKSEELFPILDPTGQERHLERLVAGSIADRYKLPTVDLDDITFDEEVLALVPPDVAARYGCIPIILRDKTLTVAVRDPSDLYMIDDLNFLTGCEMELVVDSYAAVNRALLRRYGRGFSQLGPFVADPEAIGLVHSDIAWGMPCLPMAVAAQTLVIAVPDVDLNGFMESVSKKTGREIIGLVPFDEQFIKEKVAIHYPR